MKYEEETIKAIEDNVRSGLNYEDSAELAGVSIATFYRWKQNDSFKKRIKNAELDFKKIYKSK